MNHLLELKDFHYYYGHIHAVKGIDLYVDEGEIVTIIGANGAGKSTTLNTIAGLTNSAGIKGEIMFEGKSITRLSGHKVLEKGIMTVIEGRHVFSQLSVYENLLMGAYRIKDPKHVEKNIEEIYEFFPKLRERSHQMGGTLSGGEQQMLAIGRALVNEPKLILMDEPSLGLAPIIVDEIFDKIVEINKEKNTTILLVEQNSKMALKVSNRGYVLQNGEVVLSGMSDQLLNDEKVKHAYLGLAQ